MNDLRYRKLQFRASGQKDWKKTIFCHTNGAILHGLVWKAITPKVFHAESIIKWSTWNDQFRMHVNWSWFSLHKIAPYEIFIISFFRQSSFFTKALKVSRLRYVVIALSKLCENTARPLEFHCVHNSTLIIVIEK